MSRGPGERAIKLEKAEGYLRWSSGDRCVAHGLGECAVGDNGFVNKHIRWPLRHYHATASSVSFRYGH